MGILADFQMMFYNTDEMRFNAAELSIQSERYHDIIREMAMVDGTNIKFNYANLSFASIYKAVWPFSNVYMIMIVKIRHHFVENTHVVSI